MCLVYIIGLEDVSSDEANEKGQQRTQDSYQTELLKTEHVMYYNVV